MGCNSATETSNGRAWAGCVATAMGQIMKYNQKPSTWNWSAMPNTPGSVTTSLLLKDI
ncbi:C10 family peptidase [Emticicia sp. 21SJ11W-3]|uniref:C10 family peptidase n=1 Tax=Emticicia sp. 21SJ11W-3 TaxID=2916755 RepID=UPI0038D41767